ncbi:hypothetical protein VMT65_11305 [Nocardia sp. CDC153]|uniref:hypothetical protein n=1 Tax=Nocardia sp. CDC153 TaxID=3112167 RepID=UPI002DB9B214|nr:hypothetical protein [Nocardia sp. CDC153]MEC3953620.1 hypothetical protein [Nocardia sp. CDC153]
MTDRPTPQEALDIVSATTHKARTAHPLPVWQPPLAGIMGAGMIILLGVGRDRDDDRIWLAGIGVGVAFLLIMCCLWAIQRRRGIVPRYLAEQPTEDWKRILLYGVPPVVVTFMSDLGTGWVHVVVAVVFGGIMWIGFARQRAGKWPY